MIFGGFVKIKNQCLGIDAGSFHGYMSVRIFLILLDVVTAAANVVIAREAAAARRLLAAQALVECRNQNNPYLPGNSILGPPRNVMYMPDPCQTQERELAQASEEERQAAARLAQAQQAPTPQDPSSAPAPQLSSTAEGAAMPDPAVPESEFIVPSPALNNMWSPDSIMDTMDQIANELEEMDTTNIDPGAINAELDLIFNQLTLFLAWLPGKGKPRNKKFQYLPKNQDWIGRWVPK